jgi:hypothetical protein
MSVFEILMLICFGFAWPVSIYKSITSKSIKGKSVLFLYIILAGYLFGMLHKIYFNKDLVIALYALNFTMVLIDLLLYYRNKKLIQHEQDVVL